jgi:protein-S-isoprenylcysteine O-methyltransferase Ste14
MKRLLNRYLLVKPTVRMVIEWPLIIIVGILGEMLSWARLPLSPYSHILGGAALLGGAILHALCHRAHRQAHDQSEQIEGLVTTGLFSQMRHPMYTSLMLMYLGVAFVWGVAWMLLPALLFSALTVLIALREEAFLLEKFGRRYEEYMQDVPWRFIPRVI